MLDNLIRVGPPQGSIADLDLAKTKDLKNEESLKPELHEADFKHILKKELKKDSKSKSEDKDSDQVSKKLSGGIKKKTTLVDKSKIKKDDESADEPEENELRAKVNKDQSQQMISQIMVSTENEPEIVTPEVELPKIEAAKTDTVKTVKIDTEKVGSKVLGTEQILISQNSIGDDQINLALKENMQSAEVHSDTTKLGLTVHEPVSADFVAPKASNQTVQANEKILSQSSDAQSIQSAVIGNDSVTDTLPEIDDSALPQLESKDSTQPDEVQTSPESQFKHLSKTEKNMLNEMGVQAPNEHAVAVQEKAVIPPEQQSAQQAVLASESQAEVMPKGFEEKVLNILKKENLQMSQAAKSEKYIKNETSGAVAALGNSQSKNNSDASGFGSNSDQFGDSKFPNAQKFDQLNDLGTQVLAQHTGQRSFQNHLSASAAGSTAMDGGLKNEPTKDTNVREIMNQAKILVNQGGGEMSVKMTPEGLGEVHLKVMLDNGKINIELNSQDKSVKKLIEDSLSDLKSSLAGHQMRVEHVKINNVTAVDTNNQANQNSDMNSNSNRQNENRAQQQEMNFSAQMNQSSFGHQTKDGRQNKEGRSAYAGAENKNLSVQKNTVVNSPYASSRKGSSINMVA